MAPGGTLPAPGGNVAFGMELELGGLAQGGVRHLARRPALVFRWATLKSCHGVRVQRWRDGEDFYKVLGEVRCGDDLLRAQLLVQPVLGNTRPFRGYSLVGFGSPV